MIFAAMWFGAGFGLVILIALAWDLHDYREVKRRYKLRTDWARVFEKEKQAEGVSRSAATAEQKKEKK